MQVDREAEILEAMTELVRQSRELIQRHRQILEQYDELRNELDALRAARHPSYYPIKKAERPPPDA